MKPAPTAMSRHACSDLTVRSSNRGGATHSHNLARLRRECVVRRGDRRLRILIFSPDRHIRYDGMTPSTKGVGGGITVRVRLAAALARAGHSVVHVCHTPRRQWQEGVLYLPLESAPEVDAPDVLLAQSSGGALDLAPAASIAPGARVRLAEVQGPTALRGLNAFNADGYVVPSLFLKRHLVHEWRVPAEHIDVIPNGVPSSRRLDRLVMGRDDHRLIYSSHPSKGLVPAVEVLARLRTHDRRYALDVFGGDELWGGTHRSLSGDGITDHGLVGQAVLAQHLRRATFSLHLQTFAEGFGIALSEAMAAGCIPVASPVGAFPERLTSGLDSVVLPGCPTSDEVIQQAVDEILRINRAPRVRRALSRSARSAVVGWDEVASRFTSLFHRYLAARPDGRG